MDDPTTNPDSYDDDRQAAGEILEAELGAIPRRDMLTVASTESVDAVISKLNAARIGCALVVDHGVLVGIFTERDVLQRIAGESVDTAALPVCEVMTANPDSLPHDSTIAFALNIMSVEGYRHIPLVAEDGAPVGVVGMRDIINWMVDVFPERVLNVPPVPSSYPKTREGG